MSVDDLASAIKVESLPNTELIRVTVNHRDPRQAAAIANMLTVLLIEQGQKVYAGEGKSALEILQEQLTGLESRLGDDRTLLANLSAITPDPDAPKDGSPVDLAARIKVEEQTYATLLSQYEKARTDEAMRANSISVAERAVVPPAPSKPNRKLNLVLGALVGLLGGLGLALLFENLDPSTHSAADLATAGTLPLLGQIPTFGLGKGGRRPIATSTGGAGQAAASEAFRVLGMNTLAVMADRQPRTLMLSSAEPGAGKSLLAANLAAALAQTGLRVILVDGDLHHPRLHTLFDLPREPGLSDVVHDPGKLDGALQTTPALGVQLVGLRFEPRRPGQSLPHAVSVPGDAGSGDPSRHRTVGQPAHPGSRRCRRARPPGAGRHPCGYARPHQPPESSSRPPGAPAGGRPDLGRDL